MNDLARRTLIANETRNKMGICIWKQKWMWYIFQIIILYFPTKARRI